jgi:beta-xylosidase
MPDEGIYVTTAKHPAGQWSEPHLLQEGKGLIDPCPLWDDDGQAYLVFAYAKSRSGIKHKLHVRPMAPDASCLIGPGEIVFYKPEVHPTAEGPKFLKRDGWYYILCPAGGVETGWQLALRSRNVYGPYEEKVVLEQGSVQPVNGPHQGGLVEDPEGNSWFVHFQDAELYGRVTHLQPVRWVDGWPMMGHDYDGNGIGEPVLVHQKPAPIGHGGVTEPQTTDEFNAPRLGLQWQWQANHCDSWYSLTERPGFLRLVAQPDSLCDLGLLPNMLAQKFPAREFAVETDVQAIGDVPGADIGLAIVGLTHASISLERSGSIWSVVHRIDNRETERCSIVGSRVALRIDVSDGGQCQFYFAARPDEGGKFMRIGAAFNATVGRWIGAKVGIYARTLGAKAGQALADFQYFRFSGPEA